MSRFTDTFREPEDLTPDFKLYGEDTKEKWNGFDEDLWEAELVWDAAHPEGRLWTTRMGETPPVEELIKTDWLFNKITGSIDVWDGERWVPMVWQRGWDITANCGRERKSF